MKCQCQIGLALVISMMWSPAHATAQQTTVQLPTIDNFSVGTTISVPDRGTALLGGAGSGATGRSSYGPFRSGTNSGSSFSGGSVTARAQIHNFEEMDRLILDEAARRQNDNAPLTPAAQHVWRALRERAATTRTNDAQRAFQGQAAPASGAGRDDRPPEPATAVVQLVERGRRAAARGQIEVARVYFRLAEKRGSRVARDELARLGAMPGAAKPGPPTTTASKSAAR